MRQVTPPARRSSAPEIVKTTPEPAMIVSTEAIEGIATWLSRLPANRIESTAARFAGSDSVETHVIVSGWVSPKQNPAIASRIARLHVWVSTGMRMTQIPAVADAVHSSERLPTGGRASR